MCFERGLLGGLGWAVGAAAMLTFGAAFGAVTPVSSPGDDLAGVLAQVGATLKRTERPAWPHAPGRWKRTRTR